jgi:hypothetical protein
MKTITPTKFKPTRMDERFHSSDSEQTAVFSEITSFLTHRLPRICCWVFPGQNDAVGVILY